MNRALSLALLASLAAFPGCAGPLRCPFAPSVDEADSTTATAESTVGRPVSSASQPQPKPDDALAPVNDRSEKLILLLIGEAFDLARSGDDQGLADYLVPAFPIDVKNARGDTLLILATYYGHVQTVQLLLERGARPNLLSDTGMTALMGSAFRNDSKTASLLLEHGARPDHTTPDGGTALLLATRFDNVDVARTLLKAGAQPELADQRGESPLSLATSLGHDELLQLMSSAAAP